MRRHPLSTSLAVVLGAVALSGAGCGGPGRDLFHGGAMPLTDPNVNPIYEIAPGFSPLLSTPFGYLLASNTGAAYRIAWTGNADGVNHHFTGSVWTQGRFTAVNPGCFQQACGLESDDFVSTVHGVAGGNRIDWDTFADASLDGFDFVVDTQPVMFDFFVDGAHFEESVVFPDAGNGGADASVHQIPFGLISN